MQRLLAAQPELVRTPGAGKMLPLHPAILRKKPAMVALLLERGADLNAPDPSLRTPLHHAAAKDKIELARFLLEHRGPGDSGKGETASPRRLGLRATATHPAPHFGP